MKCPQCGRWNRATLEKCFYCGAPLPQPDAQSASIWRSENSDVPKPPSTVIYSVENDDRTVPRPDERDLLAGEMQSLHTRRKRGEEQQRRIRRDSLAGGYAPTSRNVYTQTRPTRIYDALDDVDGRDLTPEGDVRPDAIPASPRQEPIQYDDIEEPPGLSAAVG